MNTSFAICPFECCGNFFMQHSNILMVVFLMGLGCLIGSIALWCSQRVSFEKEKNETNANCQSFLKLLGMGMGAVVLVPAFLHTISSTLLSELVTSTEAKFIFIGFCVAATITARRFLTTVSELLLKEIKETANEADRKASRAEELATSTGTPKKNKDVAGGATPPTQIQEAMRLNPVTAYDWKALLLIRAFLNPKFPKSRTVTGLAFDSGLSVSETLNYLELMEKNCDAQRYSGNPKEGNWWALTAPGRQKFNSLKPELDKLDMENTDVE